MIVFSRLPYLLLLLFFILMSPPSYCQYELADSKNRIIENMTKDYKGKSLTLADLDKIVREISQDGLFQVVYVEQLSPQQVVIRAQQSVKLQSIEISGNTSFDRAEILEAMDIETGKAVSDHEITQALDKLRDVYKSSGFYNFNIKYSKSVSDKGMTLKIDIKEAEYCKIQELQFFTKNEYLSKRLNELKLKYSKTNYLKDTNTEIIKDVNSILLENRFLTAKVKNTSTIFNKDKTRVRLKFTITNDIQYEFIFYGNHFFSHFDIIKKSEIGQKFLYISDSSSEIREAIIDLYLKNGFPKVEVSSKEKSFPDAMKKVFIFDVDEGPRIRIGKINIVGKISRDKSYYAQLFQDYLSLEGNSTYFVKEDVEHAAEEMVTDLKRNGHLVAELLSINYDFTKYDTAEITIQIDEGILTYVRQILFRGSKSFSNIELKEKIKIEANKPIQITEVEESFELLEDFYQEHGFLEFKIKNRNASVIQYKTGQPYADLVYEIAEGPKIYVKSIQVNGAKKTKDYVIIRELDFKPGELLNLSKVTNSIDRLEKTGLFAKVNVRSLEQGSSDGQRTIIVEVEERRPGLFSSGIGIQNSGLLTYRGYVGTLYNNLGGKGRGISSRVDLKYRKGINYLENRVAVSYLEPFISKDRLRGRVSLVRDQRLYDQKNLDNPSILSTNQILLTTEKDFTKHFNLTYNVWSFSNQEFFNVRDNSSTDTGFKVQNIATTGPIIELDYRNDPFMPTDGNITRFELEYSDPLLGSSRDNPGVTGTTYISPLAKYAQRIDKRNEIKYYRTSFSTTHYTPLTKNKRWVWANSLRGGYLKNVSNRNDSGVPQVRSFSLGGSSTIRGFFFGTRESVPAKRELCIKEGLIDPSQDTSQCNSYEIYVRKDSAYVLFKSELRFPISGALGGLVFYDGGAVVIGDFSLQDPYRDSVGFGFSYDTPVGSFVIELGYKLDRKLGGTNSLYDKESAFAFHLAIGTF